MKGKTRFTRRQFIKSNIGAALAASAFPTLIPSSALGKDGAVAPSERVVVGAIGVGPQGRNVLNRFLRSKQCQVVALCDVKQDAGATAKGLVDEAYSNTDCQVIADFRDLTARTDIDAVLIASPDHWHVLHALSAARSGKDMYVEKPLGMSLEQDQALRREIAGRQRVFQFGTQQRSGRNFRLACELVRNGHIGKLKHITLWAPPSSAGGSTRVVPPPATLDYDFWLGPAPQREHTEDLTLNSNWWYISDFALGFIAGWGIHPLDIALWGAGDLVSGVVEVKGKGGFPQEGLHDTAVAWDIDFQFPSGLTMKYTSTPAAGSLVSKLGEEWTARYGKLDSHGTVFEGENGWVLVDRGRIATQPERLVELELEPDNFKTKLVRSPDHVLNFLESVKTRQAPVSDIDSAVLSDAFCHVSDIAIRSGGKIRYDIGSEKIVGDDEANQRLRVRSMREPWSLKVS